MKLAMVRKRIRMAALRPQLQAVATSDQRKQNDS
jgi:hypothetical protein